VKGSIDMGSCLAIARQEEMGILDGRLRDGIMLDRQFISYFHLESSLLEYSKVKEAGVIALCTDSQETVMKVYLSLDEPFMTEDETRFYGVKVREFLHQRFNLTLPIVISVKDKLPMTRSGKISRTLLRDLD